ncbi:Protein cms1 [Naganishia albida]|nr:Protein cms1 [Naganishia albida]
MATTASPYTGGDDLDDGLDVAPEYIAATTTDAPPSDAGGDAQGFFSDDDEEAQDESDERDEDSRAQVGDKRKATAVGEGTPLTDAEKKKKKRKTQAKERREKRRVREAEALQPSAMTVAQLDEWLFDNLKEAFPKASDMELADLRIPPGFIMSTSQWTEPRDLSTLPAFIQKQCPPLPKNIKKEGTPSVIILSLSGIRCADVVRSLKTMEPKPPGEIAKLFAKHFKVSEQIEHLQKTKICLAAGSPNRIGKILAESEALHIRQQTVILLDLTFRDSKNRTLLSIPEIRQDFWKTLFGDKAVRQKILASGVKIGVF